MGRRVRSRRVASPTDASEITNLPTRRPVQVGGYLGNATVATLNGLGVSAGDAYVVTDAGTLTRGSVGVSAGDLVEDDGVNWVLIKAGTGTTVETGTRVLVGSGTLLAPLTDPADRGKLGEFTGFTPDLTTPNDGDSVTVAGENAINENKMFVYDGPSGPPSGVWFVATPAAHDLGGAEHNADTLADLNSKVSDATLDDAGDPRPPTAHALGGAAHSADTLANLNSKVSDATLDDAASSRPCDNTFDNAATARTNLDVYSKSESDALVVGLYDHKGAYDAATNTPDLDVSPSGVLKGDAYTVSVAGTFFTEAVEVGDVLIADQDNPTLLTHWTRVNKNIDAATTTTKGIVELATDGENAANVVVQGNDARLSDARTPLAHALGGSEHSADTLANLNAKISDATLDDAGDSRPPSGAAGGDLSGTYPNPTVVAASETVAGKVERATQAEVDAGTDDARYITPLKFATTTLTFAPSAHALGGAAHSADTLANLNAKVSDATLDDAGASRPPSGAAGGDLAGTYPNPTVVAASETVAGKIELATQAEVDAGTDTVRAVTSATLANTTLTFAPDTHALGGAAHSADTLANLNTKISDATLDDSGDSRPPSGAAGGDLSGTYPNPTVAKDVDLMLRVQQNEFGIGGVGILNSTATYVGESFSVKLVQPDPPAGPGEAFLTFAFRLPDNYKSGSSIVVSLGLVNKLGIAGDAIIRTEAEPVTTGSAVPAGGPFSNISGNTTVSFAALANEKKFAVLTLASTTPYTAGDNVFVKVIFDRDNVSYTADEFEVVDADVVVRTTLI